MANGVLIINVSRSTLPLVLFVACRVICGSVQKRSCHSWSRAWLLMVKLVSRQSRCDQSGPGPPGDSTLSLSPRRALLRQRFAYGIYLSVARFEEVFRQPLELTNISDTIQSINTFCKLDLKPVVTMRF